MTPGGLACSTRRTGATTGAGSPCTFPSSRTGSGPCRSSWRFTVATATAGTSCGRGCAKGARGRRSCSRPRRATARGPSWAAATSTPGRCARWWSRSPRAIRWTGRACCSPGCQTARPTRSSAGSARACPSRTWPRSAACSIPCCSPTVILRGRAACRSISSTARSTGCSLSTRRVLPTRPSPPLAPGSCIARSRIYLTRTRATRTRKSSTGWRALLRQRQREGERRADADRARDPDLAAVELDELAREREPEPRALDLLVRRPHLPELLEHRLLILGGDADTSVLHGHQGVPVAHAGADVDAAALGGELQGVRQEVEEHLLDLSLVAANRPQPFVDFVPEGDPAAA